MKKFKKKKPFPIFSLFKRLLPAFLLFITINVSAQNYDLKLHLKIAGLMTAEPPQIYRDKVILSYVPERGAANVGAAFAHEEYRKMHPYKINDNDVFFLIMDIPPETDVIRYRIVVDGLWMADPLSETMTIGFSGIDVSVLELPKTEDPVLQSPEFMGNGYVRFLFRGPPDGQIYLSGSFNNWDPFMYRMTETEPGRYTITLKLPAGTHRYYYLIKGERKTDPLNPKAVVSIEGFAYSVVSLR